MLLLLPLAAGPSPGYLSAKRKFAQIESGKLPAGSRVTLSASELNAWVQGEMAQAAPAGVRDPRLDLGDGTASGFAYIDFVKVRQAQGNPPGWMVAKLLGGERPVRVTTRIRSQAGSATVDVERVEIAGIPIEGRVLDFLIRKYLVPNYPHAKVGQPFALAHRIERLEVQPSLVNVVIGR